MTNVISVRFRGGCKTYYFDPRELTVQDGDDVIVETNQGLEFVHCTQGNHPVADSMVVQPLRPVLRLATENDRRTAQLCRQKEKDAFRICQKKIAEHKLEMKLVRVECNFDSSKILFFFTADGRVDFRELVKDLASVFRARIELRQIGVRDEAKMLGGLGICGRPFCCSQFMEDFVPVSIKMAKTQSLSLNPTKISGTCGRLMCCLKYEQAAYEEALKRLPKNDSFVQTPDGPGNVSDVNVLKETVHVRLDEKPDSPKCYHNCEICVLRNGKGSRDGIEVPAERPARYVDEQDEEFPTPTLLSDFTPADLPAQPRTSGSAAGSDEQKRRRSRRGRGRGAKPEGAAKPAENAPQQPAEPRRRPDVQEQPKSEGRSSRRGRSRRRSGGEGAARPAAQPQQKSPQPKQPRPQRPAPQAEAAGEQTARKKPRHRGGRRHTRRPDAPKTEE